MAGALERLERELRRTLEAVRGFRDDAGAVDHASLTVLFEARPHTKALKVVVQDPTGHLYRGEVVKLNGGTVNILADDGEHVHYVPVRSILAVRLEERR